MSSLLLAEVSCCAKFCGGATTVYIKRDGSIGKKAFEKVWRRVEASLLLGRMAVLLLVLGKSTSLLLVLLDVAVVVLDEVFGGGPRSCSKFPDPCLPGDSRWCC